MNVTHKIYVDLTRRGYTPVIDVVQDEKYTRTVEIGLREGFNLWCPPEDAAVLVRYQKPDGTCGAYDTLPDGTRAYSISGNNVCVTLAPQVLTSEGVVELCITLILANQELTICQGRLNVSGVIPQPEESEDYFSITGFIPQPETATVGQYLEVSEVDESGKIKAVRTVEAPEGSSGISPTISMERFADETGSGVRITTVDADKMTIYPVYDGKNGAVGADGKTPEKGVDYYTDADQQELVEAVLAALPDAEEDVF